MCRRVTVLSMHIKEINMREKEEIFKVTKKTGTGTNKQTADCKLRQICRQHKLRRILISLWEVQYDEPAYQSHNSVIKRISVIFTPPPPLFFPFVFVFIL